MKLLRYFISIIRNTGRQIYVKLYGEVQRNYTIPISDLRSMAGWSENGEAFSRYYFHSFIFQFSELFQRSCVLIDRFGQSSTQIKDMWACYNFFLNSFVICTLVQMLEIFNKLNSRFFWKYHLGKNVNKIVELRLKFLT